MAALFRRDKPIRPAFQTPPAEPCDPATAEAQVAAIDDRMRRELAEAAAAGLGLWDPDTRAFFNAQLDKRNDIRPARPREVPVVPGRAEASIRNYGENPW